MRYTKKIQQSCGGFVIVLIVAIISISKNSVILRDVSSATSSTTETSTAGGELSSSKKVDINDNDNNNGDSDFLIPKGRDKFRPVTSLDNRECFPDPTHNQTMQSIATTLHQDPSKFLIKINATVVPANPEVQEKVIPAICEVVIQKYATHFPHTMQQLYGCFSFWMTIFQQNSNVMDNNGKRINIIRPILVLPKESFRAKIEKNPFVNGFLNLLTQNNRSSSFQLEIMLKKQYEERYEKTTALYQNFDVLPYGYILTHAKELNDFLLDIRQSNISSSSFASKQRQEESVCTNNSSSSSPAIVPRIGILNRRKSNGRSISNIPNLIESISSLMMKNEMNKSNETNHTTTILVDYFEDKSFEEQTDFFANVDILLSPHGAQLTGLPFMLYSKVKPQCLYLLEVFPKRYALPNFFGSLATSVGIHYNYIYLSDRPSDKELVDSNQKRRMHDRAQNMCPSPSLMTSSIKSLIKEWNTCVCDR